MIHINIDGKEPPAEWRQKAERLTEQLKRLDNPDERKELIGRNKGLWKELKDWLLELSHGKCWYSEAREIVSDYHIDHFRPKNRVRQLDGAEREGYWWLAFDWHNFRVSGSVCNSPHCSVDGETLGKADYFPLKDENPITGAPNSDLEDEMIYLLDPIDPCDPPMLTFDETGYPKPAADKGNWSYERAEVTIKLLHLNYPPLVDERKKIWSKCIRLISEAQNLMKRGSVTSQNSVKNIFNELKGMASPESELSSTARACLLSSGNIWARSLVS